jgi:hypothetical protein
VAQRLDGQAGHAREAADRHQLLGRLHPGQDGPSG